MGSNRITIAGMLWGVAVIGFWLSSLRSTGRLWISAAAVVTLGLLLTAVLGAIFSRGPERAFWTGFALFGWVCLILVDWDWIGGQFGHNLTAGLSESAEWLLPA